MASQRQYIDSAYLTKYLSGITLNNDFSAVDDLISLAEEMIDGYVGAQKKWFRISSSSNAGVYTPPDWEPGEPVLRQLMGRVSSVVDPTNFTLQTYQQNAYQNDFFALCFIEIIGGAGAGQTNHVTGSNRSGQITVQTAWTTALDTTSVYRIYQLGKFPRLQDVFFDSLNQPTRYYKTIPDALRRATAAQAAYINKMGRDYFESDTATMSSEHMGSYSYSRRATTNTASLYISPEAKSMLRGLINRTGKIIT
jgi:hypothetical protein